MRALTPDEVLALPAAVDLVTAGRAFGIGRTLAHELARHGDFPVPVIKIGNRYRVRRSDLIQYLGLSDYSDPTLRSPLRMVRPGGGHDAA
jgi:hypothetical protein